MTTPEQFSHRSDNELERDIWDKFEELCKRRLDKADTLLSQLEQHWCNERENRIRPIPHRQSA